MSVWNVVESQSSPAARSSIAQDSVTPSSQMSFFARITSYPPLAEVTSVKRSSKLSASRLEDKVGSFAVPFVYTFVNHVAWHQLRFIVVLSSNVSFTKRDWEVEIWHNILDNANWTSLPLTKCGPENAIGVVGDHHVRQAFNHYTFSSEIDLPPTAGRASFTVRYKTDFDTNWQWANQRRYVKDGELVWGPKDQILSSSALSQDIRDAPKARKETSADEISNYLENVPSEMHVEARISEAPSSLLWSITGKTPASEGDDSGRKSVALGIPKLYLRHFCLVRVWTPWLAPRHGKDRFRINEDAVLCSFLRSDGLNLVLLGVSGVNNVLTVFRSGNEGEIIVNARNENAHEADFQILASVGESFDICISAIIYEARKVARGYTSEVPLPAISDTPQEPDSPVSDDVVLVDKDVRTQWLADWYEGLTYCTWNGLGPELTEAKILHALQSLKTDGISVSNLIIDDNWQSLDNNGEDHWSRGWKSFEADSNGFPAGLGSTTAKIRQEHPEIEHIGVWHALMGYWGGISAEGDLATRYKIKQVSKRDPVAGGTMLAIDPDDIQRFYEDFYAFLISNGIDAVKTDAQFFLDSLDGAEDRRRFISSYQDAWSIASLRYFGARAISCMAMTPQHLFHSQIPTNKPSILLRNSDDFYPDVDDSHPWHVFCNAHNALLTSHLNVIPDWDMFQTKHTYAFYHAAARCVSGGPIYITDKPGEHDIELIRQITAPTTRGTSTILRPTVAGRTLDVYQNYNEGNVLRIGTYCGWARTGSGIIGLFNISPADTSCIIPLGSFPGVESSVGNDSHDRYVIRSFKTGIISNIMTPSGPHALIAITLEAKGWDILTVHPVRSFTLEGSRGCSASSSMVSLLTHVAVLGLLGQMTGVAASVNWDVCVVGSGRLQFDVNLKALGVLGIYHSTLQTKEIDEHVMVMISGLAVPRETVWKDGDNVLAVDILRAWTILGLNAGWSNEVRVQVFISSS